MYHNDRFYLDKILTQAGITEVKTKTQINVIMSCWSFVVACCGSYMLDFIGRRKQALGSVAGMIVCLYVIAGMIKSKQLAYQSSLCQSRRSPMTSIRRGFQQIRHLWHDRLHLPFPGLLCILNHPLDKSVPDRNLTVQIAYYRYRHFPNVRQWIRVSLHHHQMTILSE